MEILVVDCTVWVKKIPLRFSGIFPKRLGIFRSTFTHLLYVPIYAWLQIFIQVTVTLTKLCHFKHDHPVHIMCANCPPSAKSHTAILWHFSKRLGIFIPSLTCLLDVPTYVRLQIFIELSPTVTKLCHIKCVHFSRWWTFWAYDGGHALYGITLSKLQVIK